MENLQHLLDNNRRWAARAVASDPEFFRRLEGQQAPDYLWIGCSDSRVPANEIVDLAPGELFVHRNVANVVSHADANCQSVIQFAVDVLKVEHIMVVGHYGCGGVKAALECIEVGGIADHWLGNVREVVCRHQHLVDLEPSDIGKNTLMVELNVMEQAINVCASPTVLAAWKRGQPLTIHGWSTACAMAWSGIWTSMSVARKASTPCASGRWSVCWPPVANSRPIARS